MTDVTAFTVHRFEGRAYIVQSAAAKRPNIIEYAVAHKLAEGVFQVTAIDEDDADGGHAYSANARRPMIRAAVSRHARN